MKNKRKVFIGSVIFTTILISNIAYARDIYIDDKSYSPQNINIEGAEECLIDFDSFEIDGYDKTFDEETGMYIFEYDDSSEDFVRLDGYEEDVESQNDEIIIKASAMPDLKTEITSPSNNSELMGAKDSNDKRRVEFRVINQGNAAAGGDKNFLCTIYVNGSKLSGFFVSQVPAYTAIAGKFDITLNTWKNLSLKLEADTLNEISESNENNNTSENNYFVYYCTHFSTINKKRSKSSDLLVRIDSSAMSSVVTQDIIVSTLGAWNGITDACSITKARISDQNEKEDITIKGEKSSSSSNSLFDFDTAAYTSPNGTRSIITLRLDVLNEVSAEQIKRTIKHEIGHAFGLGHAYICDNQNDPCGYKCLMMQTQYDPTLEYVSATWHDRYNLYDLYENSNASANYTARPNMGEIVEERASVEYIDLAEDLEQLEEKADYIIRAKILPSSKNIMLNEDIGYTSTEIEVVDVFKGDLDKGTVTNLREPYYFMVNDMGENCEVYRGNYSKSEIGSEYILFLSKYDDAELYGLRYGDMGRYKVENLQSKSAGENKLYNEVKNEYFS